MSGDQDFGPKTACWIDDGVRRIDQNINRASLPRAVQAIACRGVLLISGPLTKASRSALGYGEKIVASISRLHRPDNRNSFAFGQVGVAPEAAVGSTRRSCY